MDKNTLARRLKDIKDQVIQPKNPEEPVRLFQVWQPREESLDEAHTLANLDRHQGCISAYLSFPNDYDIVTVVFAKSLEEVWCVMNYLDEPGVIKQVIPLRAFTPSVSAGDVIVDDRGAAHFVTLDGFIKVEGPELV